LTNESEPVEVEIAPFLSEDRARWEALVRGYRSVADDQFETTWRRIVSGDGIHGLGARLEGRLVGIAHYLFHAHVWRRDLCYLHDLFVDEAMRRRGIGRRLLLAVAEEARSRGAPRLYWVTQERNQRARALYDSVARFDGFIRYDMALAEPTSTPG
jgi:GNAT superfamily N-acetyltransferase